MKLEDIKYFLVKKTQHPELFKLVQNVVNVSSKNNPERLELERRMSLLNSCTDAEHLRQCSSFVAEMLAYDELRKKRLKPQWVPESNWPTPDLRCFDPAREMPVEVKLLHSPGIEHDALYEQGTYGGSVDSSYYNGLERKIIDFINSAIGKFKSFNQRENSKDDDVGILYLFYSKSIDATIIDGVAWEKNMEDYVQGFVAKHCPPTMQVIILDIDKQF